MISSEKRVMFAQQIDDLEAQAAFVATFDIAGRIRVNSTALDGRNLALIIVEIVSEIVRAEVERSLKGRMDRTAEPSNDSI